MASKKLQSPPYLGTGSTLLNMAISNRWDGGIMAGTYAFIVGDSSAGKTFVALTCFAEACINPDFKDHRLIHDNVENGAHMDFGFFFGQKVADRVEAPAVCTDDRPLCSQSVEEFYFNVDDAIEDGRPFIYVLDSMDALTSDQESEKFQEIKKAAQTGKEISGSYGDGKAKKNASMIRQMITRLPANNSILIVITQTRDNIKSPRGGKTRSGGHALKFYAGVEMWLSIKEQITKQVQKKVRQIGTLSKVRIKKNRQNGQDHTVILPIYHSYGIDDLGACVDYLISEGRWAKAAKATKIKAPEFEFEGTPAALIKKVEEEGREDELREVVQETWRDIMSQCKLRRKRRYE